MGNSDDFFQQLKPAAVLKHAVLEGYVGREERIGDN